MNLQRIRGRVLALAASCAILLAAPAMHAQQDTPPAAGQSGNQGGAPSASGQSGDQAAAPPEAAAQSAPGPVGGVEEYRFPSLVSGRSFVVPRLSVQEVYDTNPGFAATAGSSQGDSVTAIIGGLSLQVINRTSTLALDYASEGLLYNPRIVSNGVVQQLTVSEKLSLGRWHILFGENFSYLPNSEFGLGGLGYLGGGSAGLPGVGGVTGFNPSQIPTQTIVAPNVSQFSSASIFQAQYLISGSSSVNGSAVVGFLHFFGNDLLNTRDVNARFGYDKALTPRDTFSLSYMATILDYPSGISGFTSHYAQVAYRRILTGRLHLSVSAGPVISHFTPMAGQTTVPGGTNLVSWSSFSSLDYLLRNGNLGASYTHGVGGGSGYFVGTTADQFSGSFRHRIGRVWSVNLTGGFARNHAIQQTTSPTGNPSASFDSWVAGGSVSRPLGHYSSVAFTYNATRQTTNTAVCANGLACAPIALTQVAGMTLSWSTRPLKIE